MKGLGIDWDSCGDGVSETHSINQLKADGSKPISPLFNKREWEVRHVGLKTVQSIVRKYHYTHGGSITGVYSFGLFLRDRSYAKCYGVSWWLPPTKGAALSFYYDFRKVLSLTRLVIVPGVPKNACSFLISHSMRLIDRQRWPCLISYADEWQKHSGTIYFAAGWKEDGYTKPEKIYVKNGVVVSSKSASTHRSHKQMLKNGCVCIGSYRKRRFFHLVSREEST